MVRHQRIQPAARVHVRKHQPDLAGRARSRHNNLDVGFVKNNRFYREGRLNLQFRSEFFNLFNRVRFGDPGLTYGTPQFGVVTSQANTPRLIQFALKLLY